MLNFTLQQIYAIVVLVLAVVLVVYLFWVRRTQEFYWNDFWYALPGLGKLRKSIRAKDLNPVRDDVTGNSSTAAEQELLTTYFNHIGIVSQERFQRAYQFLLLAKQADRRPMPPWGMPFLFILLVAEALGFGLLLAPFVASEITPNSAQVIGFIIAFVMAIIAAGLTHAAGQEIYETALIRKMRKVANDKKTALYKTAIANDVDQEVDRGEDDVTRFGNRILESVEDRGSRKLMVFAGAFVVIVLGASTVLRYENLRLAVTQQTALAGNPDVPGAVPGGSSGNPFAAPGQAGNLPPDVARNAADAQTTVRAEENYEQILGGTAGIIGLGVIFLFTQVYSTSLGIQWGHIKRRRVEAAFQRGTLGYSSYEDYKRHLLDPRVRRTERRLQQLRSGLFSDSHRPPSTFTFGGWMEAKLAGETAPPGLSAPPPLLAAPPGFDAAQQATMILDIADPAGRRARLRQIVGELAPAEAAALQDAIKTIKARREEASWIDEV